MKRFPVRQRGAALLALVAVLAATVLALFIPRLFAFSRAGGRDQVTSAALAEAREALIGWSASRDDEAGHNYRPGELPCPDRDAPGEPGYGYAEGACSPGEIGRLPWKTLGLPELIDGESEPLWYAIDGAFRWRWGNTIGTNAAINSDTRATLQVFAADTVASRTPVGSEAAAIVFAAGAALPGQVRGTLAERKEARNYLDRVGPPAVAGTLDNSHEGGPFVAGPVRDAAGGLIANDRAVIVTARDVMRAVAPRVEDVVVRMLAAYRTANQPMYPPDGKFPNPARYNDLACTDVAACGDPSSCTDATAATHPLTFCPRDTITCRGRLPENIWTTLATHPPRWFKYNLWSQTIYYAVGNNAAENPAGCSPQLQITGRPPAAALFLLPGSPLGTVVRNWPSQSNVLSQYFEDAENNDGWTLGPPAADRYVLPGPGSNDRLRAL